MTTGKLYDGLRSLLDRGEELILKLEELHSDDDISGVEDTLAELKQNNAALNELVSQLAPDNEPDPEEPGEPGPDPEEPG